MCGTRDITIFHNNLSSSFNTDNINKILVSWLLFSMFNTPMVKLRHASMWRFLRMCCIQKLIAIPWGKIMNSSFKRVDCEFGMRRWAAPPAINYGHWNLSSDVTNDDFYGFGHVTWQCRTSCCWIAQLFLLYNMKSEGWWLNRHLRAAIKMRVLKFCFDFVDEPNEYLKTCAIYRWITYKSKRSW